MNVPVIKVRLFGSMCGSICFQIDLCARAKPPWQSLPAYQTGITQRSVRISFSFFSVPRNAMISMVLRLITKAVAPVMLFSILIASLFLSL